MTISCPDPRSPTNDSAVTTLAPRYCSALCAAMMTQLSYLLSGRSGLMFRALRETEREHVAQAGATIRVGCAHSSGSVWAMEYVRVVVRTVPIATGRRRVSAITRCKDSSSKHSAQTYLSLTDRHPLSCSSIILSLSRPITNLQQLPDSATSSHRTSATQD